MALKCLNKELHPSLGTFDGVTLMPDDLRPSPNFCGRVELEDIAKFRRDFLDPKIGQIQPLSIWKNPKTGYAWIIDGVTRWRAAKEITDAKIGPHNGSFRLKCLYIQCATEHEAFVLTIKANIRNDPSQASNVRNVAICRYNLMLEPEDIAGRVYGRFRLDGSPDVKWVEEMLALNNLAPEALVALSAGRLKSAAARALSKLTPDAQRAKIAEAGDGAITSALVKSEASANGNGNGHKPRVTLKAIREVWQPYLTASVETPLARFARAHEALVESGDVEAYFETVKQLVGER